MALSGIAYVNSYTQDDTDAVVIPAFAVDLDVLISQSEAARLGGYDSIYGLASIHAMSMRQIMGADLPAAVPDLFTGKAGIAGFVPGQRGPDLPDLRDITGVGVLREACAALTKAKACQQSEHLEEPRLIAEQAMQRYVMLMGTIKEANLLEAEAQKTEDATFGVGSGSFNRG